MGDSQQQGLPQAQLLQVEVKNNFRKQSYITIPASGAGQHARVEGVPYRGTLTGLRGGPV